MSTKQKGSERLLGRLVGPNSTSTFDVKAGKLWRRQCARCLCLIAPSRDHCECLDRQEKEND